MKQKKFIVTLCSILAVLMLAVMCACGESANGEGGANGGEETKEKACTTYIIAAINEGDFFNPSAVRVLSANYEDDASNGYVSNYAGCKAILFVTIQGTNKLGGTISKKYAIIIGGTRDGDMLGADSATVTGDKLDVGEINRHIKQYWIDLGVLDG